ncbi:unnamed protein product [Nezara viridula]|uniref:SMB domain-containing protein n=1 Tax=Nezara viridula TaxID=85310 RepID=A0A9P0E9T0_NEZVI|nr:unnamed protein product [Nezara viridula]
MSEVRKFVMNGDRMTGVDKAEGQFYAGDEGQRPFCGGPKTTCCNGRQDECSMDRDGGLTKCYCDDFCEKSHSSPHEDCCWDYWHVCRNKPNPTSIIQGQ